MIPSTCKRKKKIIYVRLALKTRSLIPPNHKRSITWWGVFLLVYTLWCRFASMYIYLCECARYKNEMNTCRHDEVAKGYLIFLLLLGFVCIYIYRDKEKSQELTLRCQLLHEWALNCKCKYLIIFAQTSTTSWEYQYHESRRSSPTCVNIKTFLISRDSKIRHVFFFFITYIW